MATAETISTLPLESTTIVKPLSASVKKNIIALGLQKVEGYNRAIFKRSRGINLAIKDPEVYKVPGQDSYIIFGEAKEETTGFPNAFAPPPAGEEVKADAEDSAETEAEGKGEAEAEGEEVDETGIDANDIEVVVNQTKKSRAEAVAALKKANGEVVQAIVELNAASK